MVGGWVGGAGGAGGAGLCNSWSGMTPQNRKREPYE